MEKVRCTHPTNSRKVTYLICGQSTDYRHYLDVSDLHKLLMKASRYRK